MQPAFAKSRQRAWWLAVALLALFVAPVTSQAAERTATLRPDSENTARWERSDILPPRRDHVDNAVNRSAEALRSQRTVTLRPDSDRTARWTRSNTSRPRWGHVDDAVNRPAEPTLHDYLSTSSDVAYQTNLQSIRKQTNETVSKVEAHVFGYASSGYRLTALSRSKNLGSVTLPANGWGWYKLTYTGSDLTQAEINGLTLRFDRVAGYSELYAAYATVTLSASGVPEPPPTSDCVDQESDVEFGFGSFDARSWPTACWRPFSDSSLFNRRLPANPRAMTDSAAIVDRMETFGPVQHLHTNGVDTGGGIPIYWSQPDDPWFTLVHSPTQPGNAGPDDFTDRRIQIPDEAIPSTVWDHHITVIDQRSGKYYDFWDVSRKDAGGGEIHFGGGGQGYIRGSGLDGGAIAAQLAAIAGKIRGEELRRGRIDHALVLGVHCVNGNVVYPADGQAAVCSDWYGESDADAPPNGALVTIDITDEEIANLTGPPSVKVIARAMRDYGAYVVDTGGSVGFWTQSAVTYSSFGVTDPMYEVGVEEDWRQWQGERVLNLRDHLDWYGRMKVLDPCVAQRTC